MSDPAVSDNWLIGSFLALASFVGGLILWDRKRAADREDRDYKAREDLTKPLGEMPVHLANLNNRIERLEGDIKELKKEFAALLRSKGAP